MQIIVAAYNRPTALKNMLDSLYKSTKAHTIDLLISIDFSAEQKAVLNVAENFDWAFGQKKAMVHSSHLGLKSHILSLIKIASENSGPTLLLEDDLYVVDNYHQYIKEAYEYYINDSNVCGISLYHQPYHQLTELPFWPVFDGSDIYMMQYPSSSGFVLFPQMAEEFLNWIKDKADSYLFQLPVPEKIASWPEQSWKKWLCAWMVEQNKFMVYPRASFTTNTGVAGEHHRKNSNQFQSNLWIGFEKNARLKKFSESSAIYDSYMEHIPIGEVSFDIYGQKKPGHISTPKTLTSQPIKNAEKTYALDLKPPELNYIQSLEGVGLNLVASADKTLYENVPQHLVNYFMPQSSPGLWLKNWVKGKL